MRIFVENSGYELRNMGDLAMLKIGIDRLRKIFPDSEIVVMTSRPELLERYVGCAPYMASIRHEWRQARVLPIPLRKRWLSKRMAEYFTTIEDHIRFNYPWIGRWLIKAAGVFGGKQNSSFVDFVESCDLVVSTGGGFITDAFRHHADGVLATFALAQALGKPTAIFGQGIGPISCETIRGRLRTVGSRMKAIGIRESYNSEPLLRELGVQCVSIVCTGDDAIEFAFSRREASLGDDVGVNVRLSNYADVGQDHRQILCQALAEFLHSGKLTPRVIPISFSTEESDLRNTSELLSTFEAYKFQDVDDLPESVVAEIAKCRIVITGSYHAGVFALAQGISVVGLAANSYYGNKFHGLRKLFGRGCEVVDLRQFNSPTDLCSIFRNVYESAGSCREELLAASRIQIAKSIGLYETAMNSLDLGQ